MTKSPDVRDLLSALEAPPKPRKEKWAKVEEYLAEIYAARDRRVPWAMIAQTLAGAGIEVSAVDLRVFVSKLKRDEKKYPGAKFGRITRKTVLRRSNRAAHVKAPVTSTEAPAVKSNDKAQVDGPKPATKSKFLKMEGTLK